MINYTLDDIQIVSVDEPFIALQEELFGSEGATPQSICHRIAEGAQLLGARDVRTELIKKWSVVWALDDWFFLGKLDDKFQEDTLFSRLVKFPEAGVNECRFEVAARIFGSRTFTLSPDGFNIVKGQELNESEKSLFREKLGDGKRMIGFQYTARNKTVSSDQDD